MIIGTRKWILAASAKRFCFELKCPTSDTKDAEDSNTGAQTFPPGGDGDGSGRSGLFSSLNVRQYLSGRATLERAPPSASGERPLPPTPPLPPPVANRTGIDIYHRPALALRDEADGRLLSDRDVGCWLLSLRNSSSIASSSLLRLLRTLPQAACKGLQRVQARANVVIDAITTKSALTGAAEVKPCSFSVLVTRYLDVVSRHAPDLKRARPSEQTRRRRRRRHRHRRYQRRRRHRRQQPPVLLLLLLLQQQRHQHQQHRRGLVQVLPQPRQLFLSAYAQSVESREQRDGSVRVAPLDRSLENCVQS